MLSGIFRKKKTAQIHNSLSVRNDYCMKKFAFLSAQGIERPQGGRGGGTALPTQVPVSAPPDGK